MAKKAIVNKRVPTKQEIKIVEALADGASAVDIATNNLLKLGMTERQIYQQIQMLRVSYNCANVPHLVATFLRAKIID